MTSIKRVAVVGAGIMGAGIAQVAVSQGFEVLLVDQDERLVDAGLRQIKYRLARDLEGGRVSQQDHARATTRLNGVASLAAVRDCDLVIEAVTEDLRVKQAVFHELGCICKPSTILASNTSSLSLTSLGVASGRPDRVVGLHFFNPPTVLKLVEVINPLGTSRATLEAALQFCDRLDRVTVVSVDSPGFIVNRLLIPFIFDAIRMVETGVVSVADADQACRIGLSHAMGPLATADLIGLDTLANIGDSLFEAFGDPRFQPPETVRRMVSLGDLGKKTGLGFYTYK